MELTTNGARYLQENEDVFNDWKNRNRDEPRVTADAMAEWHFERWGRSEGRSSPYEVNGKPFDPVLSHAAPAETPNGGLFRNLLIFAAILWAVRQS